MPAELLYLNIVREELIIRIKSDNGNLIKYKLNDIQEIYSDNHRLKFVVLHENISFALKEPKKVADYIIEYIINNIKPKTI